MKRTKEQKIKMGGLAITEIILLVLSTVAFAYILASSFPVVSAQGEQCVRVKSSSIPEGVIHVPQGYTTGQQYCNSNRDKYQTCVPVPCDSKTENTQEQGKTDLSGLAV